MPTRSLSSFLSTLSPTGAGIMFEGLQRGITADAIKRYSRAASQNLRKASGIFGRGSALSKGLALGTMFLLPPGVSNLARLAIGGAIAGGGTKFAGDIATKGLDKRTIEQFLGGQKLLYGREKAMDVQDTALSSMERLEEAVTPSAIQSAITTPLQYLTYKNILSSLSPATTSANIPTAQRAYSNIYSNPAFRLGGLPEVPGANMNSLYGMYMGGGY